MPEPIHAEEAPSSETDSGSIENIKRTNAIIRTGMTMLIIAFISSVGVLTSDLNSFSIKLFTGVLTSPSARRLRRTETPPADSADAVTDLL